MKKVLLCGGGHGHVLVLKKIRDLRIKGRFKDTSFTLISDNERQYYSGMLPGYIEGIYSEDEISFDLKKLCMEAGVEFILDKIKEVDNHNKEVITERSSYRYDLISLNLGALTRKDFNIEGRDNISYTKPIGDIVSFTGKLSEDSTKGKKLIIAGGGPSGVELALAFKKRFREMDIVVIQKKSQLIPNFNEKSQRMIYNLLNKEGIYYHLDSALTNIDDKSLIITTKDSKVKNIAYDYLIISNGYRGPDIVFNGFKKDVDNFLISDDRLKVADNAVAMGDMVRIEDYMNLPRAGVFAIRQAPILSSNLISMIDENGKLLSYKPQKRYLQILNTGNNTALFNKGRLAFKNRLAFLIKDYIDRDYMKP